MYIWLHYIGSDNENVGGYWIEIIITTAAQTALNLS